MDNMKITRLMVEGGFLDGLELPLSSGLNVLIGERGTGKTSVIEVLRYTLGAESLVEGVDAAREERARSILGDGVAHVEISTPDSGAITVSRSYRDKAPRTVHALPAITVVGQGEMEAVGLEATSRLRLLDRYAGSVVQSEAAEATAALSKVRSLTDQLWQVRQDLRKIDDELAPLESVPVELEAAIQAQKAGLESASATQAEGEQLTELQSEIEQVRQSIGQASQSAAIAESNRTILASAITQWRPLTLPDLPGNATIAAQDAGQAADSAYRLLTEAEQHAQAAVQKLSEVRVGLEAGLAELDNRAKVLRARLDELQQGLSAAARAVESLRERSGTRTALLRRRDELITEARTLGEARRAHYREIDALRESRRTRRSDVANKLTHQYGPQVRIRVAGGADRSSFTNQIIEALTGSGLHYNTLAPLLADSMTPLELVEAAEQLNEDLIAQAAGIPESRAAQVVLQLAASNLSSISISAIDDAISLELLDGAEYKTMSELSIGQRCTVVLPVVLGAPTSVLVLDQPEDNLDNAFLATTIVPGISQRAQESQIIIATHNPNIPVLGDASQVSHMGSDGSRAHLVSSGSLEDVSTREAITEIMEGGKEAFERRASFYGVAG